MPTMSVRGCVIWIGLVGLCVALTASLVRADDAAAGRVWHVSSQRLPDVRRGEQFRTIGAAAEVARAGDTVLIHTGTYREQVTLTRGGTAERPIRFEAAPAAHVVITGADVLTDWTRVPGEERLFSTPWPYRFFRGDRQPTHPNDDHHMLIGRAEQVHVEGFALRQVLHRERMERGTFFIDMERQLLYVWTMDNADLLAQPRLVEASTRQTIWISRADHIHLRGLRFRYAANRAQLGAVRILGDHNVLEDCVFERTNATGAELRGRDMIVRRCTFQYNGQQGFVASRAHDLLFTQCVVRGNNTKNFYRGWEAGGNKVAFSRGAIFERSVFEDNRGVGLWFDIGNEQCIVRHNLIAHNDDAGLFYEISYSLHAHDNVIVNNGHADTPGTWGAAAGIALSSSPDCIIERNLLVGNREGFNFREQPRVTPRIEDRSEAPIWNHDNVVRRNIIAYNRDVQTRGWFDVEDERHWPAALQQGDGTGTSPEHDIAAEYRDRESQRHPQTLSLEQLNLTMRDNVYARHGRQGLFHWGVSWRRNRGFDTLQAVRDTLQLEQDSREMPLPFAATQQLDFRLPADSPVWEMDSYPRGEVPGVRLGVLE